MGQVTDGLAFNDIGVELCFSGGVLTTTGGRSTIAVAGQTNTQTFTANGTWTVPLSPSGVAPKLYTYYLAGGGGGGGGGGVGTSSSSGGGGGGGGAWVQGQFSLGFLGAITALSVTVGTGG